METTIMIAVLYILAVRIFETVYFFLEAITGGHLCLSRLGNVFALDTWAHVVGLKK